MPTKIFCLVFFFTFFNLVDNLAHDAIRFFPFQKCVLFPFFSMHIHTYTNTPFIFSNFESESSTNPYTHYTNNNWSNFDNIIAMGDEE
jgi:hypothetical protein